MPTKRRNVAARDNTFVPQVVVDKIVPMTNQKLDETSRVLTYDKNGNPIRIARQNEALDLVSPEFDLLTGIRGIKSLFDNVIGRKLTPNYAYRRASRQELDDIISTKSFRKIPDNVEIEGGRTITLSNGKTITFKKAKGHSHGGKAFSAGEVWKGTTSSGNKSSEIIIGVPGNNAKWNVGHHATYTEPMEFNKISKGEGLFVPFDDNDIADISVKGLKEFIPTKFKNRYIHKDIEMKCGGRRKAQLGLDIREGGIAIPIAKNMYYMEGRSHEAGGIGIGPNNKNGLEVEGGEVVKVGKDNIRVFSSVPFLRGASPAQLVMGGANPDTVFKAQENFKDRNRINDDGTKYETGGDKKTNSAIRTEDDKKVSRYKRAVYSLVDPTMPYPDNAQAVGYVLGAGLKTLTDPDGMLYTVNDSVSDAAWRKRLGLSYDDKFLVPNKDGSVRLPKSREKEIPVDTTMLKKRIAANTKLAERYPKYLQNGSLNEKREIVDWALRVDQNALDSLRHTYKTGEPVTINEGAYNSRQLIKDGELRWPEIMPHNVLQNYTIQYNPQTKKMEYKDVYDFNEFEWGVPGKPFDIKGSVPTKRYGGDDKPVYGSIKTKTQTTNDSKNGNTFRQISRNVMKNGLPFYQILESNDKGEMKKVFVQNPDSTYYSEQSGIRYKDNNSLNVHTFNYNTIPEDLRNYINILDNNSSVKRYGGNMLYTINGNVKNGLMSLRRKARFGDEEKDKEIDLGELDQVEVVAEKPKDKRDGTTSPVEERWIGQYRPTTVGDWIGLGGNLIGSLASYIGTRNMVNDIPMPQKPVAAPIMKLKTRFNINAPLTEINEQEQMQRDMIGRNTSSSNVSLARQQRVMNEAQRSRNQLYTQKENTETQLINQDRLNRQTMMSKNVDAYNQWLNNFIQSKSNKAALKANNFNNLISGLTGGIGDMLSRIESRRATNNTIQAMAAANPNVDARQIGNFDYYNVYDKKTGKFIRKTKRIE